MKDLSKPQKDKDIATVEYVKINGGGSDLLPTDFKNNPTRIYTDLLFNTYTGNLNAKYLNENGSIIPQEIDLPSVFTRKGEILPQDIKGYEAIPHVSSTKNGIVTALKASLTSSGNMAFSYVTEEGKMDYNFVILEDYYAKKDDLESLQTTVSGVEQEITEIKKDIGGYAKRLETANNGIEARL